RSWASSRPRDPQAGREGAIRVDLRGRPGWRPAEPRRRHARRRLQPVEALVGIEEQQAGAALEEILERQRHLRVEDVLHFATEYDGASMDRLAVARRECYRIG